MLFLSSLALALACMLRVADAEHVAFWFWPAKALPGTCLSRYLGFNCPGCGLTRAFVSLAHGQWAAAWNFNPAGWLIMLATAAQLPYRSWCLYTGRRMPPWLGRVIAAGLIAALLVAWMWRIAR